MKRRYYAFAGASVVLLGLQFVPVARNNRPGTGDPQTSREVQWILRRACYDCHSTESRWPIWAYVAPISWRVVADVERARTRVNFSDWASLDREHRVALRALVGHVTATHRMPLWYYVTLHPDARLNDDDRALLQRWSDSATTQEP